MDRKYAKRGIMDWWMVSLAAKIQPMQLTKLLLTRIRTNTLTSSHLHDVTKNAIIKCPSRVFWLEIPG